jgi:hypothetical protein
MGVDVLDFYFYITIIVALSLIYYGYDKKKSYELKGKELELENKKLELEMKKLENNIPPQKQDKKS